MANRGDIRAGRAFVELSTKDKLTAGLRKAQDRLRSFGKAMTVMGVGISAAGAAVTGPLVAALAKFTAFGSDLTDMAARTGLTTTALAELGHAAELSGASLESVEAGIRGMQKNLAGSANGLAELGIELDAIKTLSPERQFSAIAEALSRASDPTMRAALAMQALGKSGADLLPMMADGAKGLAAAAAEAQKLGKVLSPAEAAKADALGDAWSALTGALTGVGLRIGAALVEPVMAAVKAVTEVIVVVKDWVAENAALVRTVAAVGVALMAAGAAITAFGGVAIAAGMALSGVLSVLGFIASPLGAFTIGFVGVTGTLIAAAAAFLAFTETGRAWAKEIGGTLDWVLKKFTRTFGAIIEAIGGGDFAKAWKIALAALKVEFLGALMAMQQAWFKIIDTLTVEWTKFTNKVSDLWHTMMQGIGLEAMNPFVFFHEAAVAAKRDMSDLEKAWRIAWRNLQALTAPVDVKPAGGPLKPDSAGLPKPGGRQFKPESSLIARHLVDIGKNGLPRMEGGISGTFSAAAVSGLAGPSIQERIAKATEEVARMTKEEMKVNREMLSTLRGLGLVWEA